MAGVIAVARIAAGLAVPVASALGVTAAVTAAVHKGVLCMLLSHGR
jgi:hypothetical protein